LAIAGTTRCPRCAAHLVDSPSLLATVSFSAGSESGNRVVPRWRAFFQWLTLRAAGLVQCLKMDADPADDAPMVDSDEVVCMMIAGAAACCTAGGLADLRLRAESMHVRLGGWVAALRGLTQLDVSALSGSLHVAASLQILTNLEHLELYGGPEDTWSPAALLPTTLTKLELGYLTCDSLPQQVGGGALELLRSGVPARSGAGVQWCRCRLAELPAWHMVHAQLPRLGWPVAQKPAAESTVHALPPCVTGMQVQALTRLQSLDLPNCQVPAEGFDILGSLTALRRLKMIYSDYLPSCLSQLTWLTSLHLRVGVRPAVLASYVPARLHGSLHVSVEVLPAGVYGRCCLWTGLLAG
jgi:hypothetical protein